MAHKHSQVYFEIVNVILIYLTLIVLALLALSSACSNDTHPLEPPARPGAPDTTSHNFVWEVDTIAGVFSMIDDVCVISDDDAWVVGEFAVIDSLWNEDREKRFNASHWDGITWSSLRIINSQYRQPVEIRSVFALASDDIWFGSHWVHRLFRGQQQEINNDAVHSSSIIRIWGNRITDDVYFVGANGAFSIYKKNTGLWKAWNYATEYLIDIWGDSEDSVMIGSVDPNSYMGEIYRYDPPYQLVSEKHTNGIRSVWECGGEWFATDNRSILIRTSRGWIPYMHFEDVTYKIRGNALNDFCVSGRGGAVWHYNGSTWKCIRNAQQEGYYFATSMSYADHTIMVTAETDDAMLVLRGRRVD